jgi:uncharacterized membrane protein
VTLTLGFHFGPFAFEQPVWLILVPVCWALTLWLGRKSLSGLGTWSRRAALIVRLVVILVLAGAIAKPSWRREAKNVNVTVVVDESDSVRRPVKGPDGRMVDLSTLVGQYIDEASERAKAGDTVTRMTVARKPMVQSLSTRPTDKPDGTPTGATDGTNLADAITMALAVPAKDADQNGAAKRILLISDGNQTAGDLLTAAATAKAAGVPIDVLPQRYKFEREVMVERIVAPPNARMGQNINVRVVLNALKPTSGKLSLTINGDPVDLSDGKSAGSLAMAVNLEPGTNIVPVPVRLAMAGPQRFAAVFTPDNPDDDSIGQNNQSLAVTFVQSEGRVLVLAPNSEEAVSLVGILTQARIAAELRDPSAMPTTLEDWGSYDAVVAINCSSSYFSQSQQEQLRSYVHDLGGGLVMVGGPEAFGAGGWIGTPVAEALPIKLDPPQKRQMPRGALVMVMHSCEMPRGNYWGQKVAESAVENLSRLDLAGILEFSYGTGDTWVHPLSEVGNKAAIKRSIASLTFGDMKVLDGLIEMAYKDLQKADAGARHMIIITDGDSQLQDRTWLAKCKAARISITTVLVYPHERSANGPSAQTLKRIATETGGNFYPIVDEGEFAKLPSIFIKEAQIVKRSLIWEGEAFSPTLTGAPSEAMRGIAGGGVPTIRGYIVAAEREGLSIVTMRGKENDPILAQWQYGLGKSVTFTSDTGARWASSWPSWGKYRAFWEQHVRWAMRPSGNADMRVSTEALGDQTKIIVEALDAKGERLNFVNFDGRVVSPDGEAKNVSLRQVGPGRYEGVFDSAGAGAYVSSMRYTAPGDDGGKPKEGTVQAAITKPYADEYRTLEDNAALLKMVAELSGGRVVETDPRKAELWSREKLEMPVSLRSIWLQAALAALGLFLLDVGVRRVRIDPALIASMMRRGAGKSVSAGSQALGSLKEARERSQRGATAAGQAASTRAAQASQAKTDKQVAGTKFEVDETELKRSKKIEGAAEIGTDGTIKPVVVREVRDSKPDDRTNDEQGMSRLMKAKKRAQDKIDDEPKK